MHAVPGRVASPLVRGGRGEVPFDQIRWPVRRLVGVVGELLAAPLHTVDAKVSHQTSNGATGDRVAVTSQMLVQPTRPKARVVRLPLHRDRRLAVDVPKRSRAHRADLGGVERALRELQHTAHRSDGEPVAVSVDESDRHRWRGSASCAKKVVADGPSDRSIGAVSGRVRTASPTRSLGRP